MAFALARSVRTCAPTSRGYALVASRRNYV